MARLIVMSAMITGCSTPPMENPNMITDVNGRTHFYSLERMTNLQELVRYCVVHDEWEYVKTKGAVN